jgi:pyruvate formate lyase activating enzyme
LLVAHSSPQTWEKLVTHISLRRGWIDGVVVTGGEPTTDPDILDLLEAIASRGLRIKLDTNGVAPDALALSCARVSLNT